MKILIYAIIILIFSIWNTYATDSCTDFKPEKIEFIWNITSWANIRDYPCSYNSNIIDTVYVWESYSVTSKVDGWYEIILENWSKWWIWEKLVEKANTKETQIYRLTLNDNNLINKVINKMEKIINEKWVLYKETLVKALEKTLYKTKKYTKAYEVINSLVINTKKINLLNIANKEYEIYKININEIKKEWLDWHNEERKNIWVNPYSYDSRLDNTAYEWSVISEDKWVMEHKRHYFDEYYDYNVIETWFQDRWVKCKVINWTTSSESVWKFWYICKDNDCTDEIIPALRVIYDIYLAEKWQSYDAHYRAISHKDITKIWIWITMEEKEKNNYDFYVTTHYCTEFEE
jgi:hypothetical protein